MTNNSEHLPAVIEFDPDKTIDRIKNQADFLEKLRAILKEGEDFNKHSGYQKPALEKPGAEKIAAGLNCGPKIIDLKSRIADEKYGLKEYEIVVALINRASGDWYGEGIGYAIATEKDLYAYDKSADKRIIKPERISWANNKAMKMAFKSGFICASLSVGALSGYFTQDPEEKSAASATDKKEDKIFTGAPVPKKYWDLWKKDKEAAQQVLGGEGYGVAKNPNTKKWEIVQYGTEKNSDVIMCPSRNMEVHPDHCNRDCSEREGCPMYPEDDIPF